MQVQIKLLLLLLLNVHIVNNIMTGSLQSVAQSLAAFKSPSLQFFIIIICTNPKTVNKNLFIFVSLPSLFYNR